MPRKSERMTIRLTKETRNKLLILAKQLNVSQTEMVEKAIKCYWETQM